jgi:hypothetical protein
MTQRKTVSVDELYASRHRPYGQNRDGSHHRVTHNPPMESAADRATAHNVHTNQAPEDKHGPKYDNDASGWVRGARGEPTGNNETATGKPGFDRGNAWRLGRSGVDHGRGDPAIIRKPVGEKS